MKWAVTKAYDPAKAAKRMAGWQGDFRGSTLGTVEADTKTAAVTAALSQFRHLGLTVANIVVEEVKPVY